MFPARQSPTVFLPNLVLFPNQSVGVIQMTWFSEMIDRWQLKQAYKWGKGRARVKLLAFYTYQEKYPEMPKEELYYLTILSSVGFTETTALEVVIRAQEISEGHVNGSTLGSPGEPFSLRSVVKCMLINEAFQLFGPKNHHLVSDWLLEARKSVDDVIPADL